MLHLPCGPVLPSPNNQCPNASSRATPRCSPSPPRDPTSWFSCREVQGLAQVMVCLLLWWLARAVAKSRENKLNTSGPVFVFLQSNIRRRDWGIWGLVHDGSCAFGVSCLRPWSTAGGVWTLCVCVCFWLPVHLPCPVPSCAVTCTPWACFRQFGEQEGVTAPVLCWGVQGHLG